VTRLHFCLMIMQTRKFVAGSSRRTFNRAVIESGTVQKPPLHFQSIPAGAKNPGRVAADVRRLSLIQI
jgi:hypothetical protein